MLSRTKTMTSDPANVTPGTADLDYAGVARYWRSARTSILGPYMMDGFGFPAGAGQFRFRTEKKIVSRLIRQCSREGTALDLGSGIGHWTEFFAHQFAQVVAVEASQQLYDALEERCSSLPNVTALRQNALSFQPCQSYEIVFGLLRKLRPCLGPNASSSVVRAPSEAGSSHETVNIRRPTAPSQSTSACSGNRGSTWSPSSRTFPTF
jgi:hypothetical protein